MSPEENKQIVRGAFEALMAGDLRPLDDLFTAQALVHQCGFLEPLPAQTLVGGAITRNALPGGQIAERIMQLERIVAEDDLVALHWTVSGRFSAPEEPEIDGAAVSVPWMTFVRLADGKIAEMWNIRDTSTLQTQLHLQEAEGAK
jgi:ketosteroid isomerase-like protein